MGNWKYWLFQLSGWGSFGMINIFFAFTFDRLNPEFFERQGLFLLLGLIFSHFMRVVIIWMGLVQKSLNKQVPLFLIISFCFMVVVSFSVVVSHLNVELLTTLGLLVRSEVELLARTNVNYWISSKLLLVLSTAFSYFLLLVIWNLIYFVFHYVTSNHKQKVESLPLDSLVKA